jgi:hypothetical protein
MPRSIHRCPNCGETVTPFAAGCAVCGADLEAARRELASKRARRRVDLPSPRLPGSRPGSDWFNLGLAFVLALTLSPVGFLLAVYWANQRYNSGDRLFTGLMLAAAVVAVAAFVAPGWIWRRIY